MFMDISKIGSRIKELKELKNLKQDDLMELTGFSRVTISNYEQGKVKPPVEFLMKLAKTYDVSMDWLCGLSDEMTEKTVTTYADLFDLIKSISFYLEFDSVNIDCSQGYSAENDATSYMTNIRINDEVLYSAFREYDHMFQLWCNGTISQHLFNLWVKDKQNDLSKKQLPPAFPF